MNITGLFIRRPVMTTLVMLGVLIFGMIAYTKLPVSDLPNVDYPTINVSASLPGASPETMAAAVATPLEKQFSTIAGHRQHDVVQRPGIDVDHDSVHARPRTSTPPRRTSKPAISQALVNLPTGIIPPVVLPSEPRRRRRSCSWR